MQRLARATGLLATLLLFLPGCGDQAGERARSTQEGAAAPSIGIVYTAPHPVINDIIDGFKTTVSAAYPDAEFSEDHAQGDENLYGEAVLRAIRREPDLLAPITTPVTQIAVDEARGNLPIVFMGVTDPVGAGVAESLESPRIATGSSDLCPFQPLVQATRALFPDAQTIGLPYNPGDQPAVFGREQLMALAPDYGFEIVDRQVGAPSELPTAVTGLASRVDVVLIAADNLMMENPSVIATTARERGVPTVACDRASVEAGAVAGVSVTYREVGEEAGRRAVRVLQGESPREIPIGVLSSGETLFNKQAACEAGVYLPDDVTAGSEVLNADATCPAVRPGR